MSLALRTGAQEFTVGTLAFIDSFAGLVPCKVVGIVAASDGTVVAVRARVTARRPGWRAGEIVEEIPYNVVPRVMVRRTGSGPRVVNNYQWKVQAV